MSLLCPAVRVGFMFWLGTTGDEKIPLSLNFTILGGLL